MMGAYDQLRDLQVPSRKAAALVGVSRTTVYRKPAPVTQHVAQPPPNKLSDAERDQLLEVLNSPQFVDMAPLQVFTKLLDEGLYFGSVSTFYRVLADNRQVKERRRLATHPPRAIPELVATAPNEVLTCYAEVMVMPTLVSDDCVGAEVGVRVSA